MCLKWLKSKKILVIIISVVGILFLVVVGYWLYAYSILDKFSKQFKPARGGANSSSVYFSQLDGSIVSGKQKQIPEIVGVMIDNHADARPQSGLSQARVVYESLVEGGMTRYLAIFNQEQTVAKVGPVRSARLYYIDWIKEFGYPLYLFCGGSPQALSVVDNVGIMAANQFYWGNYYWRDDFLSAPHNLFTSSSLWQKLPNNFVKASSTIWLGWKFNSSATSSENIKSIHLPFSDSYEVTWQYSEASSSYERYLAGVKQFDREGKIITADNVVAQFVSIQLLDEVGRLQMDTSGGGEVRVLRKGGLVRGTWQKENTTGRTRFYDKDGQEITLAPGKTWVEVLPSNAVVKVEN